jgi:hypothetical protein
MSIPNIALATATIRECNSAAGGLARRLLKMQGTAFWKDKGDNVRRRAILGSTFVAIAVAGAEKEQQQYEEDEGEGNE